MYSSLHFLLFLGILFHKGPLLYQRVCGGLAEFYFISLSNLICYYVGEV